MPWLQLSFDVADCDPEQLSDLLTDCGAVAVTLLDGADQPVYEPPPGATPLWSNTRVTGLFAVDADLRQVQRRLCAALHCEELPGCELATIADQDWARVWMVDFHPMRFGSRLWICPTTMPPPDPLAVNIMLDPGLAFGTGTHPTTALCLEWLDAHPPAGLTVIDYGCGSGVLAIAAAKLGAHVVHAVDIDPQALLATTQNAAANAVAAVVHICAADELPAGDLILANILAGPLQSLAPHFAALLRPGGVVVLAGLLEAQADELLAAYAPWFDFSYSEVRDGWLRLAGRRRSR
ncbi:MAG: 50S ribosomal protein L11 methyltransferase [Gammaproteobacteria bacterium]